MIDYDDDDQPVTRIAQNNSATQLAGKIILEDAQQYFDTMSQAEHAFLQKSLNTLIPQDAYFQVLADAFNLDAGAKLPNDALNFLYFWQLINDVEDIEKFNVLELVNTDFFQTALLHALDDMQIGAQKMQRRAVIADIFKLYQQGYYVACVPVLYAQLEGLLTDVLLAKGFLEQKETKFLDVYKIVPGLKANEIKSLWHKSKIATEMNPYFAELAAYKMDSSSTVTMSRHNILHGSDMQHFTQARSFILLIWLFSVVSFMRGIR